MTRGGHNVCTDKCLRIRTGIKPNYDLGDKFCRRNCMSTFRNYSGILCPCCSAKLATTSRRKRQRLLKKYQKYMMPNEIDFKTMPLFELMIKYPRIRDKY